MAGSAEEICLIDSGIRSLHSVPLGQRLKVINLHCNQIERIECLEYLQTLQHLDLSSNQISNIVGLDYLVSLRTLNLACNLIEVVKGLQNLRNLVKVNLSYNQIADVSGLCGLHGPNYRLSQVELQGNRLQSVQYVTQCLQGCVNLRHLSLMQGGADNPLCQEHGYREKMLSCLHSLDILDGKDRLGRPATTDNILADIPGLEQYMEYLVSNGSSSDVNPLDVATPNIDADVEAFRQRGATTPEITSSATLTSEQDTSHSRSPHTHRMSSQFKVHQSSHETRLEKLENQLAQLLYTKKNDKNGKDTAKKTPTAAHQVPKHRAKRDIDETDESEDEKLFEKGVGGSQRGRGTKSCIPNYQRTTHAFRGKKPSQQEQPLATTSTSEDIVVVRGRALSKSPKRPDESKPSSFYVSSTARDEKQRDDLKNTYVHLMKELENERERRWKAEQATKKLVDHVRELQSKGKDERDMQEVSLQTTGRLKEVLTTERENKLKLQAEIELLKEQLKEVTIKLDESESTIEDGRRALRTVHDTSTKREQEQLQQQAHEAKKLQEACMRASASQRELEIVRSQVKSLQGQVQQLQELLAAREQQHRKDLAGRYTLDSKELQDVLGREISRVEKLHVQELKLQQEKIDSLSRQYEELEDEFRMALQIESKRFTEVQDAYQKLSLEAAKDKQELTSLLQRGDTSSSMVSELTALVKEQKGRLTELSKAKQEQSAEYRERVSTLEHHLEEARKRMLQLEILKQEKVKLSSQIHAQESVMEGLKAERKLWGEELAHQGVSLAQDRGRMEAKIESLNSEVAIMKKHLEREADAVRIKTKMIEDQTESIRRLKEGLVERDEEIKKVREEMIKVQKDCEEQILSELTASQELQEKLDRARERKEELKHQLIELEDKLDQSERSYSQLSSKWKQKSGIISELEHQVSQMKATWDNKEKKLTVERDKAVEAARLAVDKLKAMDDAFRQQLDSKEQRHNEIVIRLQADKEQEVDSANKRVLQVEEEMRELLKETDNNKRNMEDRVKKLTRALGELQQDLL